MLGFFFPFLIHVLFAGTTFRLIGIRNLCHPLQQREESEKNNHKKAKTLKKKDKTKPTTQQGKPKVTGKKSTDAKSEYTNLNNLKKIDK